MIENAMLEYWMIKNSNNKNIVNQKIVYNVIDLNLSSFAFLAVTPATFSIFAYRTYEKGVWNRIPFISLTRDIAVNIIPCLFFFPILIVAFSKVNPYDLWIVKSQASFKGSCFLLPLSIGVIGIVWGDESSNGTPI